MNCYIWQWEWRGQRLFEVFARRHERRKHRRRMLWMPESEPTHHADCTAEEVGQLMGGN